jgi:hypothetical protein
MNFEDVTLTKIFNLCDKKTWMHNIHDIRSIINQNSFVSNTQWYFVYEKFKI